MPNDFIECPITPTTGTEYLYDKPYEDNKIVRVAGPFTVESLSPHRTLGVDENDELIDPMEVRERPDDYAHLPSGGSTPDRLRRSASHHLGS
jgi:adenine-specific DNA-methyltransferase